MVNDTGRAQPALRSVWRFLTGQPEMPARALPETDLGEAGQSLVITSLPATEVVVDAEIRPREDLEVAPLSPETVEEVNTPELELTPQPVIDQPEFIEGELGAGMVLIVPTTPSAESDEPVMAAPGDSTSAVALEMAEPAPSESFTCWQDDQWPDGGIIVSQGPGLAPVESTAVPELKLEATPEPELEILTSETPELAAPDLEPTEPVAAPELEVPAVQAPECQPVPEQELVIVAQDDTPADKSPWWRSSLDRRRKWLSDKQHLAQQWIAELRSNRHKQVHGAWEDTKVGFLCTHDRECAIQVAKNTFGLNYGELEDTYGEDFLYEILRRNDGEQQTFKQIADYIEETQLSSRHRERGVEMER